MTALAKGLEAVGIALVLLGLVQGIQKDDMWTELYLSVAGIIVFLIGWGIEKVTAKRLQRNQKQEPHSP